MIEEGTGIILRVSSQTRKERKGNENLSKSEPWKRAVECCGNKQNNSCKVSEFRCKC